jgi:hypothetical protein
MGAGVGEKVFSQNRWPYLGGIGGEKRVQGERKCGNGGEL